MVWDHVHASGNELLVLLALADWADDYGYAFPSYKALAKRARITPRTAMRVVKKFVGTGDLEVTTKGHKASAPSHRAGPTGLQPRNLYRLTCMPLEPQRCDTSVTTSKRSKDVTAVTGLSPKDVTPVVLEDVTPAAFFSDLSLNDPSGKEPSGTPSETPAG